MLQKNLFLLFLTVLPCILFAQSGEYALVEIETKVPSFFYIALSASLIVIAIARLISSEVFSTVSISFVSVKNMSILEKEGWNSLKQGAWLLTVNYLISSCLGLYLFLEQFQVNSLLIFSLIIYFFTQQFFLLIIGLGVGKLKSTYRIIRSHNVVHQILGLCLFPMVLMWVLNDLTSSFFAWLFFTLILLFQLYKILRGFVIALRQNFEWYYIILYLCTLEILPILVLMRYLGGEFWQV